MVTPPVLILAFNRPDETRAVIESLRPACPRQLFFAVDGPRPGNAGDTAAVSAVRSLAGSIDWPCEVRTLFREENLGCKAAVSAAISWFFEHVDQGIILEDDCVAHPSFFRFAAELLDRYRADERVMMISGDNFQPGAWTAHSYYFSRYTHIWGWATWRRAWKLYDHRMTAWPEMRDGGWLVDILRDEAAADYWTGIFEETYRERNASWAYRWMFSAWSQSGLSVIPNVNLVSNIGFSELATHMRRDSSLSGMRRAEMAFPLVHPPFTVRDERADSHTQRTIFARPRRWRLLAAQALRAIAPRR
jgi:hypothetical protein